MVQDKKKKNKKNKNKNKPQATQPETPPEVTPPAEAVEDLQPPTKVVEIVNGVTTNQINNCINNEESAMKGLAAEASQWMTYNWAAIQDAEAKYQTYLATSKKV